jgi:transposase
MHKVQELVRMHRMGVGAREVARLLGVSPNTERFWRTKLDEAGLLEGSADVLPDVDALKRAVPPKKPPQQVSSVDGVRERIALLHAKGASPKAIWDRLRLDGDGQAGSYYAVKRLCAQLAKATPPRSTDVAIPVETLPGQVGQVDFGYAGMVVDPASGKQRRGWVFVIVLCHSRHQFARVVFDQSAATWQQLHVEAFAFFGGVPEVIVPDNLKAAVTLAAFGLGTDPALNRSYRELARHYGFKVDPTPPRDPEKKGKVERGVQYVKRSALATLPEGLDATAVNRELLRWCVEVAGTRVHGTTRRRPVDVFEAEERGELVRLPERPFVPVVWKKAKVHRDSHIVFGGALYSVPWRHLGVEAWVRATPDQVSVYVDDERVADHRRIAAGMRSTIDAHLPADRRDFRHRGRDWWEQQARLIGPEVAQLVAAVFDKEDELYPLRKVQAIVKHLEGYPKERAENAARRARRFEVHSFQGVRDILKKGLDFEDAHPELPLATSQATYRFTRPVQDMLGRHIEGEA